MPKKIIVFCDGTWNKEDQKTQDGVPCPTNVLRMLEATKSAGDDGELQIVHYIEGVGTRWWDRVWGGGFGLGISANIKDAYRFIVSNYDPGDGLFLIGFSRGAFTARSIAGFINNLGILRRDKLHLVNEAYDHYRDRSEDWRPRGGKSVDFRTQNSHPDPEIAFLGVWDTVGALGAPFGLVSGFVTDLLFKTKFHDVTLSPIVKSAYHALAIDERRWPFRPTLWTLHPTHEARIAQLRAENRKAPYEQRWFPGAHSDVGGGYETTGLSDCALAWMIEKAQAHGLHVVAADGWPLAPDPLAPIHDSQRPYYRFLTKLFIYRPRDLVKRLPRTIRNRLVTDEDVRLMDFVDAEGDFHRPVAAVYHGELSECAKDRLASGAYAPDNVEERTKPA